MRSRIFTELSGGERQRVKIAIALAQQPKLMLLDEPTQHLDLGRQIELMALLQRMVERGITLVAAMHDLALVREHCTSGILLSPNAGATVGRVEDLLQPDRLKHAFSVEGASLQRYLATQTPAEVTEDSSACAELESLVNAHRIDSLRRDEGTRRIDEGTSPKRCRYNP
jgi:ABC-type cobalamin/Fe3+-siderophores transport system ATPase subunit